MPRIPPAVFGVMRVCVIAAAAASVLIPFYAPADREALLVGSSIAAVAGIASFFAGRYGFGRRAGFTGAVLGAAILRFMLSVTGLFVFLSTAPAAFKPVAMSLLVAYLILLAVETVSLCRMQGSLPPHGEPR